MERYKKSKYNIRTYQKGVMATELRGGVRIILPVLSERKMERFI